VLQFYTDEAFWCQGVKLNVAPNGEIVTICCGLKLIYPVCGLLFIYTLMSPQYSENNMILF